MVRLISLKDLVIFGDDANCVNLMIVRYQKDSVKGVTHFPYLAPSEALLKFWKNSDGSDEAWKIYTKEFCREMSLPTAQVGFQILEEFDKKGLNMNLICYCPSKEYCHRSLLVPLLEERNLQCELV